VTGEQEPSRSECLRARVRQLILMRETGPKSRAWHAARLQLIWQLHDELRRAEERGDVDVERGKVEGGNL